MSNKTFIDLKTELKLRMGRRSDLENIDGKNFYEIWINYAYQDITKRNRFFGKTFHFYFPQLETIDTSQSTEDGVAYIDVPTGTLVVRQVWDKTNDRLLNHIGGQSYLLKNGRADTSSEGQPTLWVRSGNYIYLYPTPDDAYEMYVYYRKMITILSDTLATTDIGEEWDELILEFAAYKGHMWLKEYDDAEKCKAEFIDMATNLLGIYDSEELAHRGKLTINPSERVSHYK